MTRRLVALAAGALAVVLISSTFDPADARSRGGSGGSRGYSGGGHARAFSGRAMSAPRFYGGSSYRARSFAVAPIHRHRHFRGRGFAVGVPLAYGAYYYGNGCEWLRRKALYTGSGYWWDRYYACLDGYY